MCGGTLDVLIEAWEASATAAAWTTDAAAMALRAIASRTLQVFIHIAGVRGVPGVEIGIKARCEGDNRLIGTLGSEALDAAVARDAGAAPPGRGAGHAHLRAPTAAPHRGALRPT